VTRARVIPRRSTRWNLERFSALSKEPWRLEGPKQCLGKRGKTPPCCESGSLIALRFSRQRKILNVSQRIHLRFFSAVKIKYQSNLPFLATGRFCLASRSIRANPGGVLVNVNVPENCSLCFGYVHEHEHVHVRGDIGSCLAFLAPARPIHMTFIIASTSLIPYSFYERMCRKGGRYEV
jgi:hypothetical protein